MVETEIGKGVIFYIRNNSSSGKLPLNRNGNLHRL